MKRSVLVLLYTLGITVICYPCQAEPTPYGYDYLGDDKLNPEPKRKPKANDFLSRLGRDWFGQNSGLTLTNEQQQYTPKNEVSLPISHGSDMSESSEGLILPNVLSGHNLYAPTKELSDFKSLNGPDWDEPNKVVMSKGQPQYANKNELFLSNRLYEFDLYLSNIWNNILNEQKKELTLPSPNEQDSSETDIGLILSDGYKKYEPDKEIFLSNSLSSEAWTGLNGGMSLSNEPNQQIQYANKEKVSLPKAVRYIWYRSNVDVYLPKRQEENWQSDKPKKGIILQILPNNIQNNNNNDVHETLNKQILKKRKESIKVVMRHQEGIQINNKVKDDISLTLRSKQRTHEGSSDYLDSGENYQEHGGQNSQEQSKKKHHKKGKGRYKSKKKDKNKTRFEVEHNRKDSSEQDKKKPKKKVKKHKKKKKRFEIVDSRLKGQYKQQLKAYMQNVPNFQNHHNSDNQGHPKPIHNPMHKRKPEPQLNKPKEFREEYGDGPIPEILIRRPDIYWSKRPSHYFK